MGKKRRSSSASYRRSLRRRKADCWDPINKPYYYYTKRCVKHRKNTAQAYRASDTRKRKVSIKSTRGHLLKNRINAVARDNQLSIELSAFSTQNAQEALYKAASNPSVYMLLSSYIQGQTKHMNSFVANKLIKSRKLSNDAHNNLAWDIITDRVERIVKNPNYDLAYNQRKKAGDMFVKGRLMIDVPKKTVGVIARATPVKAVIQNNFSHKPNFVNLINGYPVNNGNIILSPFDVRYVLSEKSLPLDQHNSFALEILGAHIANQRYSSLREAYNKVVY